MRSAMTPPTSEPAAPEMPPPRPLTIATTFSEAW